MKTLATPPWYFIREWVKQATHGGSWPVKIAKSIALVIALVIGVTADSKVSISVLSADDQSKVMPYTPPLGWLIFGIVAIVWLAVALGRTWIGFKMIQVGDRIEADYNQGQGYFRLPVQNLGWFDTEVRAYAVAVADENGLLPAQQLSLELDWMHQRKGELPKLRKGIPQKVDVFVITWASPRSDARIQPA